MGGYSLTFSLLRSRTGQSSGDAMYLLKKRRHFPSVAPSLPLVLNSMAMKLGAASSRGQKRFVGYSRINQLFSMIRNDSVLLSQVYPNSDPSCVIRSLTYFEDAKQQADPITLNAVMWPPIKQRVQQAVRNLL